MLFSVSFLFKSCKKENKYSRIEIRHRQTNKFVGTISDKLIIEEFEKELNNSTKLDLLVYPDNFEYVLKCYDNNGFAYKLISDNVINSEKHYYRIESSFYKIFKLKSDSNGDVPN